MNNEFVQRVRSAAIAAWWTVLIAALLVTLQWVAYMVILSAKPAWFLALCGPDIAWSTVQTILINAIATMKICMWVLALLAVWLTLWSRRLRHI
jgi:hypothetical protein